MRVIACLIQLPPAHLVIRIEPKETVAVLSNVLDDFSGRLQVFKYHKVEASVVEVSAKVKEVAQSCEVSEVHIVAAAYDYEVAVGSNCVRHLFGGSYVVISHVYAEEEWRILLLS